MEEIAFFQYASKVMIMLVAIMNPFYVIPAFMAATEEYPERIRNDLARKSAIYAYFILSFFLLIGDLLLFAFGITMGAFKIGGGILIFLIGLNLIFEKPSTKRDKTRLVEQDTQERDYTEIALVPLAIPLIAGPGTITTVLILKESAPVWYYQGIIFIALAIATSLVYIVNAKSKYIIKLIGILGINAISKIMGLILVALSVQTAANGIKELF